MENTTIAILLLLLIIFITFPAEKLSEHMGLDDVLKEHVMKNTGHIPYVGPTSHEIATQARLMQHTNRITPPTQARNTNRKPGVSEHMDDSMGERGEDALEVSLKGGSGWSVFYG